MDGQADPVAKAMTKGAFKPGRIYMIPGNFIYVTALYAGNNGIHCHLLGCVQYIIGFFKGIIRGPNNKGSCGVTAIPIQPGTKVKEKRLSCDKCAIFGYGMGQGAVFFPMRLSRGRRAHRPHFDA